MFLAVVLFATTVVMGQARPLLDVPYIAQTPELCGGAAVSMVMRYWGARDVLPEDFSSLVVPRERGIPTEALTEGVRHRRWQALVGPIGPDAAWTALEQDVNRGRPVIALIEVAPGTYHYVVVVGLTSEQVVLHDPARSPFRVQTRESFERDWAVTKHWSVVLLPPVGGVGAGAPAAPVTSVGLVGNSPCSAMVTRAVDLAAEGQAGEAEALLRAAAALCPTEAGPRRELAGLRFLEKRWDEAARLASVAVQLAPDDAHARRLLATSRYLSGDQVGALEAWAHLGEPTVDTITVEGALRLNHPDVIRVSGLVARRLLTAELLMRAQRRVAAIPALSRARVSFTPVDDRAAVSIAIFERDVVPRGWVPLGTIAGRAVLGDQLAVDVHGALHQGERLSAGWRWTPERRRVAISAAFPSPGRVPGVVAFEALWERQTYAPATRQSRQRLFLRLSDWATSGMAWRVGAGTDRFDGRRHLAAEAGLNVRLVGDRVSVDVAGQGWTPLADGRRFGALGATIAWRSSTETSGAVGFVWSTATTVSRRAPLAVWPSAGSGGRGALLRAHPLFDDDVVRGPVFGSRVATTTAEYWHPVKDVFGQRLFVAAFGDVAQAWRRVTPGASRLYLDAGVGLRLATLGGTVRADVARGLRGGGTVWSVGWMAAWPRVF